MSVKRLTYQIMLCLGSVGVSFGQVAPIDADSELVQSRTKAVKAWCGRDLAHFKQGLDSHFNGMSHDASCRTRMLYLETALDCAPSGEVREWVYTEASNHWECMEPKQQFFFAGSCGQYYYSEGRLDSALYYSNLATEIALAASDTSRFFVALSNLAVVFTEIRWYPEALSSSLWAYDLSVASSDTSSLFFAYVVNNLVSGHLDLQHVEHAVALEPRYARIIEEYGNEELKELRFLNVFRLKCLTSPEEAFRVWTVEREIRGDSVRAQMLQYLSSNTQGLSKEQVQSLREELTELILSDDLHPNAKLNYLVSAISLFEDVSLAVRQELLELELNVRQSNNVFIKRDFYEMMAHALQSSEYWQKFRESVHDVDSASALYSVVFSNILRSINQEALQEHRAATYGASLVRRGKVLLWIVSTCAIGLLVGLLWVLRLRNVAVGSISELRSSQELLKESDMRYSLMLDQLKELSIQPGQSVRKAQLVSVIEMHTGAEAREREQLKQWMDNYGLTRTEAEVLARVALGWSNSELVNDLNLAKSYIHNVRGQIRKKLNIPKNLTIEDFISEFNHVRL